MEEEYFSKLVKEVSQTSIKPQQCPDIDAKIMILTFANIATRELFCMMLLLINQTNNGLVFGFKVRIREK